MKWTINQEDRAEFIEKHIKQPHKNARQPSSGPNTPSADTNSRQMSQAMPRPNGTTQVLENIGMAPVHVRDQAGDQLHSGVPRGTTPPSFMNPGIGRLAYTPDRGTRNGYAIPTSPSPSGSNPPANPYYLNPGPTSHGPARSQPRAFAQTQPVFHSDTTGNILGMHSPGQTMLTSTGYLDDHPFSINSLMTPAPREQQPTLQPASAMRMPSSFMGPTSSPAPFWKFMSDTPQNFPLFASPQQRMPGSKGDLQSSSPPPDDQRRDFGSPVRMNASQHEHHGQAAGAVPVADSLSTNGNKAAGLGINTSAAGGAVLDDDLEGGIDLANTWQTIGQYHEKLSRASGMATAK